MILPILLFYCGLVSMFVLGAEVMLRLTESRGRHDRRVKLQHAMTGVPDPKTGMFFADPRLGYTCRPNSLFEHENRGWRGIFEIDADGMRRFRHLESLPRPANPRARLLIVGDSYAFSMGTHDDESIDHFFLQSAPGMTLKNVSSPGWSPEQYLLALESFVESIRPTHVYVLLCHLNDLYGLQNCTAYNRFKPTVRGRGGKPDGIVLPSEMARFRPFGESIFWESRLAFAIGGWLEPGYLKGLSGVEEPYGVLRDYSVARLQIYSASLNAAGEFDAIWGRFDYLMQRMGAASKAGGFEATLLVLPLGEVASFADVDGLGSQLPTDSAVATVLERVRESTSRHGVGFLYPEEPFSGAGRSAFSEEGHYGPVGNRLLAEAILAHLLGNPGR